MQGRTPEARGFQGRIPDAHKTKTKQTSDQGGRRRPRKKGKNQKQNNPTRAGGGGLRRKARVEAADPEAVPGRPRVQAAGPEAVPSRPSDQQAGDVGADGLQAGGGTRRR
ncbi:hypothetical protein CRENBAI_009299 [Crenichthys baileyi]|uniref:Uncharacterized protein n=1 Tax=Crenichthys baileyi TaxID=28760 RepID=A0AAV9SIR2_9TELE